MGTIKRSKEEKRLRRKRLKQLEKAVGRFIGTLGLTGKLDEIARLSPELRRMIRAHDQCHWNNILEDLDDETL